MAFNLPLPKVVADVGPGGGIPTAMNALNNLSISGTKAQYEPMINAADAASKLAYANLMGPQFLAKLMGNQDILANLPDPQKQQALNMLYQAGSGQGTGGSVVSSLPYARPQNSLLGFLYNKLTNYLSGQPQPSQQTNVNALNTTPVSNQPTVQTQKPPSSMAQPPEIGVQNDELSQATNAWIKSPEAQAQAKQQGMMTIPNSDKLLSWYRSQQGNQPTTAQPQAPVRAPIPDSSIHPSTTFAENTAAYKGVVKEGEEAGKIRADDIKELNDTYFDSQTKLATLNDINDILGSDTIKEIRQLPLAGRHEIGFYAKEGTSLQQKLIGKYVTLMGNVVKDAASDFKGQFRVGEQALLNNMKVNPADTIDVAMGKSSELTYLTKLLSERSRLTSEYMSQYHINKLQATEMADKQLNGDKIRQEIEDKLHPKTTIRNTQTGEIITVPVSEARTKYGVKI